MQKFFSLLCATLLVFSASAAPVAPKAQLVKKAPAAVEQMQNVQFEQAQTLNINQLSATPALTVSNQKAEAPAVLGKKVVKEAKQKAAFQAAAPAKAPQAEPIVVEIVGEPSIAPAGDVQAITVIGNDNMIYAWGVKATSLEAGKTYAFTDMSADYTYRCSQDYFSTFEDPTDATFSIDAEENITASIVTESGTYLVYTTAPQPQPSYEIVDVTAVNCNWADYETDMMYTLSDANGDIYQFDIYYTGSFELGHTYTYADMDKSYSCYATDGKGYAFETAEFTLTENEKGLKHIVATVTVPAFNKQFNITWDQPEPQSKTIVASDFSMTDYETDMFCILTDSVGNQFRFDVLYTGSFEFDKTYTLADMDPDYSWYKLATGSGLTYTEASFTVTEDQDELLHVVAAVVLNNGDSYEITYDEKAFVPTGVKIDVNGTDLNGRYMSAYGFYLYTATWGDYTVQLAFDAEEEKAAYTNEEFIADYSLIYSDDEDILLFKLASDNITITNTETTKTLAGSVYAKNGDEYVLNLVYEKPDAKYIDINVAGATLTNKSVAGFWTISGQTADKNNSFSIYFISKALQGTWTDVAKFDSYSTWVSDKSSGSNVYYENLSEVNLTSVIDGDSLKITGTMSLADNNGNPAIVTVYITTPFTQTWGEWADFAPFDKNTGKYTFATFGAYTQVGIQVLERKDNTGLKQYKLKSWSKGYFDGVGQDLILNMNPDYTFTFASNPINLGADVYFADVATAYNNPAYASFNSYDPETGVFSFYTAVVFASNGSVYTAAKESLVMDKPITERDTVDIVSTALKYNDLIASNKVTIYYAADVEGYYLFRVTSNNATSVDGTFKWSDGTINDPNSYFSVTGEDKNYFQDGEFTVVTNNKDIALTGWMIGTDEKYYRLDMSYTAPTERDTLRFSGKGVTISECTDSQSGVQTGWFYELADASTGYEFLLQSTVVAEQYGTFSYADKTLGKNYYNVFDPEGNRQQFVEGSITVSNDGSEIVLDGELIAEDEKVYVLHFTQSASVLNYDTDAPFDATFEYADMSTDLDEGVIGIYATNAEGLTIGLELYADPTATKIPEGVYTISDSQEAGTALKSLGVAGGYLTECFAGVRGTSGISDCWFLVEGTITLSYDEYGKLKVVVDAKNSYDQPVTALVQYVKLEPKKTVDFTDAELYVYEGFVEQYGIMNFYGGNADGYKFDLYAYADTIAGDFLEAIDFGDCELTSPAGSIGVIDAYEFKVERDGKNLTLTAKLLGSDTVQYNITATGYLGYIGGDAKDAYKGEFTLDDIKVQQIAISKVNCIYILGANVAGDKFALVVEGELEDGVIAAGEYTNVMACTGYDAQEQINPSFVTDADNNDWFIQSGKLTVAEDGSMIFEGVNSYDAPAVIKVTVPEYYLVGFIDGAIYGIEDDIDNLGEHKFVDGKVTVTFSMTSYVQVKNNATLIFGTENYVAPVEKGSAIVLATGTEKIGLNAGRYEFTLDIAEDGTKTLNYVINTTGLNNAKANMKAAKRMINGQIVIVRENKEYNILGTAL